MDQTIALEHAHRYADLVFEEFSPCKVILFGSLANGNFNNSSDIDIAVVKDSAEDYWETSKKLNRLTRSIDNRIEPVLLQNEEDQSGFLATVLKSGIYLK
jgi:predicted nucleotidyltransferase